LINGIPGIIGVVSETGTASDTLTTLYTIGAQISETVTASETDDAKATFYALITEIVSGTLTENGETGVPANVSQTARASDSVSGARQWELINTGTTENWQLIETIS